MWREKTYSSFLNSLPVSECPPINRASFPVQHRIDETRVVLVHVALSLEYLRQGGEVAPALAEVRGVMVRPVALNRWSGAGSISTTWEYFGCSRSWVPPQTYWIRISRGGAQQSVP